MRRWFILLGIALMIAGLGFLAYQYLPDRYNPWAVLNMDSQPTFVTKFKIMQLKNAPEDCFEVLSNSGVNYERITDRETGESCGFKNAAVLKQSGISYGGDIRLTCPALVSLLLWERHAVLPLAQTYLGQDVQRIRHYGTYACRNINNARTGRRSEHAYANAIDIAGFQLADNTEISVLDDWPEATPEGEFVRAMHASACDYFKTVLGPEYNAQHANHFHFDFGGSFVCR
ncbi:extensin-like domain-containing protein [Alteromonas oceanisediminis]|uniref:extensin-like domain-containing protein n=1 Tax=Alteromonas oceanisediminis TaxID=2836180 RepID=UPI001BD94E77|nr:extensin family protein [Alteromonas oceanisediminis]MBT0587816.1 extensin family protein [Alteromonas oceanisediminis]